MYGFYQSRSEDYYVHTSYNNNYPPHLHRQVELFYVRSGKVKVRINDTERVLGAGDFSICFPNIIHSTETIKESISDLIIFSPEILLDFTGTFTRFYPDDPYIQTKNAQCMELMEQIRSLYHTQDDFRLTKGYLYILFSLLFTDLHFISNRHMDYSDTCRKILTYINENFTSDLSLEQMARDLKISRFYISHIFSNKFTMSFPDYLNRTRIDYARNLLLSTDMSITEVGFECGFNNSRSFNRAFQKFFQCTPMQFRKSGSIRDLPADFQT